MSDELEPGQILELRERARERLSAIPGVVAVGFGLKEVGGELTERRALRVYVAEKRPLDQLAPDEVVPDEIEGIETDVLTIAAVHEFGTPDTQHHSPLLGGVTITNRKPGADGLFGVGTLGCFATVDGLGGPKNVVLLTNNHIVTEHGGAVGDTIYQPRLTSSGGVDPEFLGAIAAVHNIGLKGARSFAYPGQPAADYYVDAGTALLNIDISSWCDCNCGVSYKNELREIATVIGGGNSKLEGVAAPEAIATDKVVFKTGSKTGATKGTISDPIGAVSIDGVVVHNVIIIAPDAAINVAFADHGDSGAALVNDENKLIGLVVGGQEVTVPNPVSYACHIAPVLDLLKVTPISTQNPPVGPAGHARSSRLARVGAPPADEIEDHTVELQERLRRTPIGAALFDAFLDHRSEVVGLVNGHRPTTIAWHRGKGPTFFAHVAENARNPGHRIPSEIDGVTRRALIERMEEALVAAGSEPLRAAVSEHRAAVLALIDEVDDLHELVGRFEERTADV